MFAFPTNGRPGHSQTLHRATASWGMRTRAPQLQRLAKMMMRTSAFLCALIGLFGFAGSTEAAEIKLEQVSIYPGEFSPDPLIVRKGEPLKLLVTTQVREHVNRISILPWVARSDRLSPGKTTVVEFTPDETGDFVIRNIGHGFTGILRVVE